MRLSKKPSVFSDKRLAVCCAHNFAALRAANSVRLLEALYQFLACADAKDEKSGSESIGATLFFLDREGLCAGQASDTGANSTDSRSSTSGSIKKPCRMPSFSAVSILLFRVCASSKRTNREPPSV